MAAALFVVQQLDGMIVVEQVEAPVYDSEFMYFLYRSRKGVRKPGQKG